MRGSQLSNPAECDQSHPLRRAHRNPVSGSVTLGAPLMILQRLSALAILFLSAATTPSAQTQKPLTNADILNMTKQGFNPSLIVTDIQSSTTNFDTSPQALIDLKNASVDSSVMEAMLAAQASKPTGAVEAVRSTTTEGVSAAPSVPTCTASNGCLLREGTAV